VSERISNIHKAVEKQAGRATHVQSAVVKEQFEGKTVWEGVVEVFDLHEHPKAKRAYGWQRWEGDLTQYTVVLEIPPVDSPENAVRAATMAEETRIQYGC
jgi:hypothetical protein